MTILSCLVSLLTFIVIEALTDHRFLGVPLKDLAIMVNHQIVTGQNSYIAEILKVQTLLRIQRIHS